MTWCELLAIEICRVAAEDYRWFNRELAGDWGPREKERIRNKITEIEMFFLSEYGQILCLGNGEAIIEKLRKEKGR